MDRKTIGTILGAAGVVLWFMPLAYVTFRGQEMFQAGHHIGGIAYLLLLASVAYAALSWMEQHVPRIIAASVAAAVSLLFLFQAGTSSGASLFGLVILNMASTVMAVQDNMALKAATAQTTAS